MKELPRRSFDLMLTDPPWALPATYYAGRTAKRRWSDTSIFQAWWRLFIELALPLMKKDATIVTFCGGDAIAAMWPIMYEAAKSQQLLTWVKDRRGTGTPFQRMTEHLIVSVIGSGYRRPGSGMFDALYYPRLKTRVHSAQKPKKLLMALIRHLCPDDAAVFDPFAGSFSTEAACKALGVSCTSIEWGEELESASTPFRA